MDISHGALFASIAIFCTVLINASVIRASLINVTKQTISLIDLSSIQIKLLILMIYMGISAYAILPQQLKVFSVISAVITLSLLLAMCIDNINALVFTRHYHLDNISYEPFNFNGTGLFLD